MKTCFAAELRSTINVILFVMAFVIWNVAPLCAQSNAFGGIVIGLDGKPLAGLAVRARPEAPNTTGLSTVVTQTDAEGRYRFETLPSGIYFISTGTEDGKRISLRTLLVTSFESAFYLNATGTVQNGPGQIKVMPILMGPARITLPEDTISSFDLMVLPSVVSVSGRLEIPVGVTIPPTRASLTRTVTQTAAETENQLDIAPPLSPSASALRAVRVDALSEFTVSSDVQPDGTFQFVQIPPGTYALQLSPNLGMPAGPVTVTDQDVTGITLGGKSTGVRVSGYTARSDQPPFKDKFPEWVYMIAKGAMEFLPQQRPTLIAAGPDRVSVSVSPRIVPARAFVNEVGEEFEAPIAPVQADGRFDFLAVPAGEYYIRTIPEAGVPDSRITVADRDIDSFRVGDGARVRGEVISTNSGTRPPDTITLISTKPRGQSVTALVDANGSFEFPKIGAGVYRVLLDGKVRPTPAEVTVGDEDLIFRVETPFRAWVPGRVVFDGPVPPPESMEVTRAGLTNGYASEIKPDGSFQIKSDEGEFDFFMLSLPEGYIVKSVVSGGANLLMESVKVDLRIPNPEILVTLQYKPETPQ